jgi:hypothetical protein
MSRFDVRKQTFLDGMRLSASCQVTQRHRPGQPAGFEAQEPAQHQALDRMSTIRRPILDEGSRAVT